MHARIITYRASNPIWMIENCIPNSLLYHINASWIVLCRVMSWRLYFLLAQHMLCYAIDMRAQHMHGRYSFLSIFATALQFDHFGQFSCYTSHLIRTIYCHCASCKMLLIHFIHTQTETDNLDNTLTFAALSMLFSWCIWNRGHMYNATDAISIWLSLQICNANDIIWLSSFSLFESNWVSIWDAAKCNCQCKWREKAQKIKTSASGSLISTGSIFHNANTYKVRTNWIDVVDKTKLYFCTHQENF